MDSHRIQLQIRTNHDGELDTSSSRVSANVSYHFCFVHQGFDHSCSLIFKFSTNIIWLFIGLKDQINFKSVISIFKWKVKCNIDAAWRFNTSTTTLLASVHLCYLFSSLFSMFILIQFAIKIINEQKAHRRHQPLNLTNASKQMSTRLPTGSFRRLLIGSFNTSSSITAMRFWFLPFVSNVLTLIAFKILVSSVLSAIKGQAVMGSAGPSIAPVVTELLLSVGTIHL